MEIKDSGDRTEFETGAVRDMHKGKGRMDLLPWEAIISVSKHCENGARKYGEHNVDKGIPVHSFCDSAARHLAKYMSGHDDEDHLVAAVWNLLWALQMRTTHPDMVDVPYYIHKEEPKIVEKVWTEEVKEAGKESELRSEIERIKERIEYIIYRKPILYEEIKREENESVTIGPLSNELERMNHRYKALELRREFDDMANEYGCLSKKLVELSRELDSMGTHKDPLPDQTADSNSEADLYADEEDKAAASAISSFIDVMEIKDK